MENMKIVRIEYKDINGVEREVNKKADKLNYKIMLEIANMVLLNFKEVTLYLKSGEIKNYNTKGGILKIKTY